MRECLELVPGVQVYTPPTINARAESFSDLQVASDTVCWVGDINRLKPKVWNDVKHKLESSSSLNTEHQDRLPGKGRAEGPEK